MSYLFNAYSASILSRSSRCFLSTTPPCGFRHGFLLRARSFEQRKTLKTVNADVLLTRFHVRCYSSRKTSASKPRKQKVEPKPPMEKEKNAFFVVRKGDIVGIYKNFSDCQAQVGSSICDPPVSVYKGFEMPKGAEDYIRACGLKNALYSIRAADLKEELFGTLVPCTFQQQPYPEGETSSQHTSKRKFLEVWGSETGEAMGRTFFANDPSRKLVKLDLVQTQPSRLSCVLEFDGASKGNPGQAGAGAVLRTDDGCLICRLREGLGVATNNVAEYRAMILGLKYALRKGFTSIRVLGDSKLVCMQVQGSWKVKNQNISRWYEEAKGLKDKFLSFQITHVLREFNSDADAQANLAVDLADGQVQEEFEK